MSDRLRRQKRRQGGSRRPMILAIAAAVLVAGAGFALWRSRSGLRTTRVKVGTVNATSESIQSAENGRTADKVLTEYMTCLAAGDYEGMYALLDSASREAKSEAAFIERNRNIYEGIAAKDITLTIIRETSLKVGNSIDSSQGVSTVNATARTYSYTQTMNTLAGPMAFDNEATLHWDENQWRVAWDDSLIFPDLGPTDTIRVSNTSPARGNIYDRNGILLAGSGAAVSVGLVRGRMGEDTVARLAKELGISEKAIENRLEASWVTDDVLVPIRTIQGVSEEEKTNGSADVAKFEERDKRLLEIPGVLLSDTEMRTYPLGEAAAHLIGYVQSITSEELEADTEGFYNSNSLVGKVGLESLYEERLRGKPGKRIRILSENGDTIKILASSDPQPGENITLTIDSHLQEKIYSVYQGDPAANVALDPRTGEVLALVSTPSYDNNLFLSGLSQEQWDSWTNDPYTPMVNRFRAVWTPGSSFKSVIAAIGLTNGSIDEDKTYKTGSSWQMDESWGSYKVTTLHEASPGTVEKALVVSDNVWFARRAVAMGAEALEEAWKKIGFGEQIPFPIQMKESTFSNEEHVTSTVQLADSGYGQGQIQVNPLHLALIYSAFMNDGNMLQPTLEWVEDPEASWWKEKVFTEKACKVVRKALVKAVESGTGKGAKVKDLTIAGKTGTAELKKSQEDVAGTELGWFAAFTPEEEERPLLLVTMVEDVKYLGGSGYVTQKNKDIFSYYCNGVSISEWEDRATFQDAGGSINIEDFDLAWDEDIDAQELGMIEE